MSDNRDRLNLDNTAGNMQPGGRPDNCLTWWSGFRPHSRHWFALVLFLTIINLGWAIGWYRSLAQEGLHILACSPQGTVAIESHFRIQFDRAMATQADVGKTVKSLSWLACTPTGDFEACWESSHTLLLTPRTKLKKATPFTVHLTTELQSLDGKRLAQPFVLNFATPALAVTRMVRQQHKRNGEVTLQLEFNDVVKPEQLKQYLACHDGQGKAVSFTIVATKPAAAITLQIAARNLEKLLVTVQPGLTGVSGPLAMNSKAVREFALTAFELAVENVTAHAPAVGELELHLAFSDPVKPADVRQCLTLEPPVKWRFLDSGSDSCDNVKLCGEFATDVNYTVRLQPGLTSSNGWQLKQEHTANATFENRSPLLRLASAGSILRVEGNAELAIETVNLSAVKIQLYRIYSNNIVHFLRNPYEYWVNTLGWPIAEQEVTIAAPVNTSVRTMVRMKELIPVEPYGSYYLIVSDRRSRHHNQSQFLLLTELGLTLKQTDNEILVWVTSLASGLPIEGATVSLLTATNQKAAEKMSDHTGVAVFALEPDTTRDKRPFLIQAELGGDWNVLQLGKGEWNLSRFATSGQLTLAKGYRAFVYADRGVYRPGELVHFATLVRSGDRAAPAAFPLQIELARKDGVMVHTAPLALSDNGTAELTWEIPTDARTGFYLAKIFAGGVKKELGCLEFQVEEFVPDRLKVKIAAPETIVDATAAVTVRLTVTAQHLYGTPAADCRTELRVFLQQKELHLPQFPGYTWGDPGRSFKSLKIFDAEARTLADGTVSLPVPIAYQLKPPTLLQAEVECKVYELGGRATSKTAQFQLAPYPAYLGLHLTQQEHREPGQPVTVEVVAVKTNGELANLPTAKVRVLAYHWRWSIRRNEGGGRYEYLRHEREVTTADLPLQNGRATYLFVPEEYATHAVVVEDVTSGMRTVLEVPIWGDSAAENDSQQEFLEVQAAQPSCAIGTLAQFNIRAPFDGMALVCLERDKLLDWQLVEVTNRVAQVSFTVKADYLPNVYCTATLVRPGTATGARYLPGRVYGATPLTVDTAASKLQIQLTAPDEIRPKRELEVVIAVKQGDTPLAGADVTLAAVDEGICQITAFVTPDPYGFFYGREALQVRSADIYSQLIREEPAGDKSFSKASTPASTSVRRRFESVALWQGFVRTDERGEARVRLNIPQYLGELRLMAVAAKQQTFGSTQRAIKVTQPLILEVSAPRFAAWDDAFTMVAVVRNAGKTAETAVIGLKCDQGLRLLTAATQSQSLNCGEETACWFTLKAAQAVTNATLEIQARLGEETMCETIYLPLRPPTPQMQEHGCGTLELGKTTELSLPTPWLPGTGQLTLSLSQHPNLQLKSNLDYLLDYPYGCVEQTTSRSFSLLYLDTLLPMTTGQHDQDRSARKYVEAGIARLSLMQTSSGGLAMWPGGYTAYPWGTIYASHFLAEAKQAGYRVSEQQLNHLTTYLKNLAFSPAKVVKAYYRDEESEGDEGDVTEDEGRNPEAQSQAQPQTTVSQTPQDEAHQELQAYAFYVLTLLNKVSLSQLPSFMQDQQRLGNTARCFAAATLARLGKVSAAEKLLGDYLEVKTKADERETGGNLHSAVRDQAIYLNTLLDLGSGSPKVEQLVAVLLASAQRQAWHTTQENGYGLLALGKYAAQFYQAQNVLLTGKIMAGDQELKTFDQVKTVTATAPIAGNLQLSLVTQGSGKAFYTWSSSGIMPPNLVKDVDDGLKIRRRILDQDGKPQDLKQIRQGDTVWVELTLQGNAAYQNLALQELLPSGFEAENPRLTRTNDLEWHDQTAVLAPEYLDVRDDRLDLFVNLPSASSYKFYYAMRAVFCGKFYLAPAQVHCMYHPFLKSNHGATWLEVSVR